ncbi:EAL domain-containing protein [Shewanella sp. OMA3-2]|uniref:EAL domain-containing protein n=1 Tax=Shewanella sp. OMA3-2 TaxID=2908650 RepID=UPI001F2B0E58|nr:GGDEF domain-containing protein [Shewanella sp. OMA3-2]UJF20671.1 GGDEF domain-containing protein [Shewanella sp. OMA3-2]
MGLSKSFQFVLLIVFGLLFYRIYTIENRQVQIQGDAARQHFAEYVEKYSYWTGNGDDLFKTFSRDYDFQFFQYVHNSDSIHNFTYGSLVKVDQSFADKIFNIDLGYSFTFPDGRMQIVLSPISAIETSLYQLEEVTLLLFLAYLLLMLLFVILIMVHKRRIKYAAQYIDSISTLSFQAVEMSRLRGILQPLGLALEKCRARLKESLDVIRVENDKLTKAAYQDPITSFSTRPRFIAHLERVTQSQKNLFGVLVVIRASELANINQLHGRTAGDDYLAKLSHCIRHAATRHAKPENFRISSGDFAVFLDGITLKESASYVEKLKQQFDDYTQSTQQDSVAHIGVVPYQSDNDPNTLVAMSDYAVSIAQTLGPNHYHFLAEFDGNENFGDEHWKVTINDIINRRGVKFFQQPILPCNTDNDLYRELLARFYNAEEKHLPTATVIAMSERYGLSVELDKMIVTNTLTLMKENPMLTGMLGVNISATSALQESFVYWLKEILTHHRKEASRFVFEVNESGMQANLTASANFVSEIHKVGAKVAIERFGLGFTSFKFFREVRPDYIKLDNSYSSAIESDNNNKFFIRMIVDIAKRLKILVIATGVERQDEKLTLEKLLVDGLQGYYIAKPDNVISTE